MSERRIQRLAAFQDYRDFLGERQARGKRWAISAGRNVLGDCLRTSCQPKHCSRCAKCGDIGCSLHDSTATIEDISTQLRQLCDERLLQISKMIPTPALNDLRDRLPSASTQLLVETDAGHAEVIG